jgi:protein-tyrosine phosphatase
MSISVTNPLWKPYRTGSYLVYDVPTGKESESQHFRSGMSDKLPDHRYRGSGSHQLNLADFTSILGKVVDDYAPSTIYVVDLREETHGFFDLLQGTNRRLGAAVSWYADNDFGNVGQPWPWIVADEAERLAATMKARTTQVFAIQADAADNRAQERMMPTGYDEVLVDRAYTEADLVAQRLRFRNTTVQYLRIPVTDHCAPSDAALDELRGLRGTARKDPRSWVHFHCHGGDGRTTTFLALYDMLCWSETPDPLPSMDSFARRQCQLFSYCLNPSGSAESWKTSLAEVRWTVLENFLNSLGE